MDLLEYLRLLRRRWRIVAACALVAGVATWLVTPAEPSNTQVTYTATHQILRDASASNPQAIATVALFVKTGEVPVRAADRLDYRGEPAILAGAISLTPDDRIGTLDITARGNSREQAADRANVFAEETLAFLGAQAQSTREEQIERTNERLATLQADIDALNDEIRDRVVAGEEPGVLEAERDSKLRQYGAALDQQQQALNQPPPSAGYISLQAALPELASVAGGGFGAPESREGRTALAVVLGLLAGLAAVLVLERLDTRFHDPVEMAEAFGLPVLTEVPRSNDASVGRILTVLEPMSATAESFRALRAALLLSPVAVPGARPGTDDEAEPQVILVTSGAPGDGKTTVVANLAVAMAETGRRVLVLGCDFRRPEIHTYFAVPVAPGIAEVLADPTSVQLRDVVRTTAQQGVSVASSGNQLRSFGDVAAAGRELIRSARGLADIVLVDTPPLLATNDASELVPAVDAVVVVARIDKTTRDGARRVRDLLGRLRAPVAGLAAVGVAEAGSSYASYYTKSDGRETVAATSAPVRTADGGAGRSARENLVRGQETAPVQAGPDPGEADPGDEA